MKALSGKICASGTSILGIPPNLQDPPYKQGSHKIDLHEGDWESHGSVKSWSCTVGNHYDL